MPPPSPRARFSLLRRRASQTARPPANQLAHGAGAGLWSRGGGAVLRSRGQARCFSCTWTSPLCSLSQGVGDESRAVSRVGPSELLSRACPWSPAVSHPSGLGPPQPRNLSGRRGPAACAPLWADCLAGGEGGTRKRGRVSAPARREARGRDSSPKRGQPGTSSSPVGCRAGLLIAACPLGRARKLHLPFPPSNPVISFSRELLLFPARSAPLAHLG